MPAPVIETTILETAIGRIVVPPRVPRGFAVFYTTLDFHGRLDQPIAQSLSAMIAEQFGITATLTSCSQIHGTAVIRALSHSRFRECDACDALWSRDKQTAIVIKIADCLPVTIIDPRHSIIANVHSGWRGAVRRITAKTLDLLQRETHFDAPAAFAWLGPSIRLCCFEVGEEVAEQFQDSYRDADRYIDRSRSKPHIDVPGLTVALLRERGLADDRIVDTGLCTRCEGSLFHSYRRDGAKGGRNLAIAAQ